MNDGVAADVNGDVLSSPSAEKEEKIAWLKIAGHGSVPHCRLLLRGAWHGDSVLGEDPADEPRAVERPRCGPAEYVPHSQVSLRRADHFLAANDGAHLDSRRRGERRCLPCLARQKRRGDEEPPERSSETGGDGCHHGDDDPNGGLETARTLREGGMSPEQLP